jgi:hypothetical protein
MNLCLPIRLAALALLCAGVSGCALIPNRQRELFASPYHPTNVFVAVPALPAEVRLVTVFPITAQRGNADLEAGADTLGSILLGELAKTGRFQVFSPGAEWLHLHTGQEHWSDEELLPADFFERLRRESGCDAVLFCRLTSFRTIAPLAVGWRMRLVDARTHLTLWAVDEVVDAGQPAVRVGARRFQLAELETSGNVPDEWFVVNAPRQFGQYATAQLLATLPRR